MLFKGYGAKVGLGNMRVKAENRMVTGITPIRKNDRIVYLCPEFQSDNNSPVCYQPVDSIVAQKKKDLKVNLLSVPSGTYRYGYCLVDLYGRRHYTRFTDFRK